MKQLPSSCPQLWNQQIFSVTNKSSIMYSTTKAIFNSFHAIVGNKCENIYKKAKNDPQSGTLDDLWSVDDLE